MHRQHDSQGDVYNAFIFLARAATVTIEKMPQHSKYDTLSVKHKTNVTRVR